ncbi:MAG: nickel pincer cofactor biosynthesis protein LarB [Chloroflexia bacterium]|nr:nickel pincer cofactor biosynthesis protein LarB [Chloroflexia bacterium]
MTIGEDPFAAIRRALDFKPDASTDDSDSVRVDNEPVPRLRLDPHRTRRTGIPEIVLAERKTTEDVARSLMHLARASGRALASRVRPEQAVELPGLIEPSFTLTLDGEARLAVLVFGDACPESSGGRVAVISAGASDRPVAREAQIMAEEMGSEVMWVADVGVAGLHRLIQPLQDVVAFDADAVIVAAGMDGALPAVIAGLVSIPVIGLPVSVGYGYGGDGTGALMSMLQSCAPGIAVVNIDNGIGAGSMAALIANRAATARAR